MTGLKNHKNIIMRINKNLVLNFYFNCYALLPTYCFLAKQGTLCPQVSNKYQTKKKIKVLFLFLIHKV